MQAMAPAVWTRFIFAPIFLEQLNRIIQTSALARCISAGSACGFVFMALAFARRAMIDN